jgi:hypothetical protein
MAKHSSPDKWVRCLWNLESGDGEADALDVEFVRRECPYGCICELIADEGRFLLLKYQGRHFRIKPFSVASVPRPSFLPGDYVRAVLNARNKTPVVARVCSIGWHANRSEFIYYLEGNHTRRRKMYFSEDLEITA